jgi:uncharacterized protein YbjT (DUF2867 family)
MDRANTLVTVFGGSGFVGTQVVQLLARRGYRIRVAVRRPDLAQHLKPLGAVGQIQPIQANLRNADSVFRAANGAHIVINLVGIGYERGKQLFRAVHTMGARNVAQAAKRTGATTLIQMSALGAGREAPSAYARSKALGEAEVLAAFPDAVIIRPSIIFGPGDSFFNLLGTLARYLPVLPLIGGASKFQPVYVGDVADAFAAAVEGKVTGGRVYELGGPEVLTHREILGRVLHEAMRDNPIVPVPPGLAKLMAAPFALLPFPPLLTGDQVDLLQTDNVVSAEAQNDRRTLSAFGVTPTPLDAIIPGYLWRFRKNGQFDRQPA